MNFYYFKNNNLKIRQYIYDVSEIDGYGFSWHDEVELIVVLKGEISFSVEGQNYMLTEDDVFFINSNIGHLLHHMPLGNIGMTLRFSPEKLNLHIAKGHDFRVHCLSTSETRKNKSFTKIRYYAAKMFMALLHNTNISPLTLEGAYCLLLSILGADFPIHISSEQERAYKLQNQKILSGVLSYLKRNFARKISLNDVATILKYNRTYTSSFFKNNVGVNFYDYLMRVRFSHAFHELNTTSKSLTAIAIDNGFSDLKTFDRYFKNLFFKSPSQYRKEANDLEIYKKNVGRNKRKRAYLPTGANAVESKIKKYLSEDIREE